MPQYRDYKTIRNCAEYRWIKVPHELGVTKVRSFVYNTIEKECDGQYTYNRHNLYFRDEKDAFIVRMLLAK